LVVVAGELVEVVGVAGVSPPTDVVPGAGLAAGVFEGAETCGEVLDGDGLAGVVFDVDVLVGDVLDGDVLAGDVLAGDVPAGVDCAHAIVPMASANPASTAALEPFQFALMTSPPAQIHSRSSLAARQSALLCFLI